MESYSLRRRLFLLTLFGYCISVAAFRGVIGFGEASVGQGPQVWIAGVHVHHFVFGFALLAITLLLYRLSDGGKPRLRSLMTGVGFAMVLDETSMWFPLGPKGYWAIQNLCVVILFGLFLARRFFAAGRQATDDFSDEDESPELA